jgi:hypothetical protein
MEWRPIHRFRFTLMELMFMAMGTLVLLERQDSLRELLGEAPFSLPSPFSLGLFLIGVFTHWRKGINFSREKK